MPPRSPFTSALAFFALLACGCGSRTVSTGDAGAPGHADLADAAKRCDSVYCCPPGEKLECSNTDNGVTVCRCEEPSPAPGEWTCTAGSPMVCRKTAGDRGLPGGGQSWTCHEQGIAGVPYRTCAGNSATKPGGGGWSCRRVIGSTWVCNRRKGAADEPPGGGHWACRANSALGGLECERRPSPAHPPSPSAPCRPGEKAWCDGLAYSGWGQATCGKDGRWASKIINGKRMLDCQELPGGQRPDTDCSCFHFFFNPACCERPDCIVPPSSGPAGRVCMRSGGQPCNYCNPQRPECDVGVCVISNTMESFCSQPCDAAGECPSGWTCHTLKKRGGGQTKQCVPDRFGCYDGP